MGRALDRRECIKCLSLEIVNEKRPRGVEDNKMKLKEIGSGVLDKKNLTQNR